MVTVRAAGTAVAQAADDPTDTREERRTVGFTRYGGDSMQRIGPSIFGYSTRTRTYREIARSCTVYTLIISRCMNTRGCSWRLGNPDG